MDAPLVSIRVTASFNGSARILVTTEVFKVVFAAVASLAAIGPAMSSIVVQKEILAAATRVVMPITAAATSAQDNR